jgi:hypothetical protein
MLSWNCAYFSCDAVLTKSVLHKLDHASYNSLHTTLHYVALYYTTLHCTALHCTTFNPTLQAVAAALASGEESHLPAQLKDIPRTLQKAWRGKQTENERGYSVDADAAATARALIVAREREEELNSMAFLRYV